MMEQLPQRSSGGGGRLFDIAVIFCVAATIATLLLVAALVLWLAESINSLVGALCTVGGSSAIISLILYLCALRPQIEEMGYQVQSLANIVGSIRQSYNIIINIIQSICRK